jgi:hypothetical protein
VGDRGWLRRREGCRWHLVNLEGFPTSCVGAGLEYGVHGEGSWRSGRDALFETTTRLLCRLHPMIRATVVGAVCRG